MYLNIDKNRVYLLVVIALSIILNPAPGCSQSGYGVEAGLGVAYMHFIPSSLYDQSNSSPVVCYRVSGVLELQLTNKLYIQSGLILSRQGDTRNFSYYLNDSFNESISQKLTVGYAEIPLNVVIKTGKQGKIRAIMGIGASPSYLFTGENKIHARGSYQLLSFDTSTRSIVTNGNPISNFDVGLDLFLGLELPTGWVFKFSYVPGVNDIGAGGFLDKNRAVLFSVGRFFGAQRNINKEADDLIDHTQ